jgi:hypothetical protein
MPKLFRYFGINPKHLVVATNIAMHVNMQGLEFSYPKSELMEKKVYQKTVTMNFSLFSPIIKASKIIEQSK